MSYGNSTATWSGVIATGAAVLALASIVSVVFGAAFDDEESIAKRVQSMRNLRDLGMANAMYAADWNDNQYSPLPHNFAVYGNSMEAAFTGYRDRHEREVSVKLHGDATLILDSPERRRWLWPVSFDARPVGSFRMTNVIHDYVNGEFYGSSFYAPNDSAALDEMKKRAEGDEADNEKPFDHDPESIVWSSYAWSPAGRYSPEILSGQLMRDMGFRNPFSIRSALRVPMFSQCRYPDLKTHMIEHHWLQNPPEEPVNAVFGKSRYSAFGGEPYYFNHGRRSAPNVVFYDGHVSAFSMDDAAKADARSRQVDGGAVGLWLRNPGGAVNGYYENMAVDDLRASPHIFTADGILGRDVTRE